MRERGVLADTQRWKRLVEEAEEGPGRVLWRVQIVKEKYAFYEFN